MTCPRRGSNSGPSDYETDVIPTTPQRPVAIETGNITYKPPPEDPFRVRVAVAFELMMG
jgi:hypothetical protein